MERRARYTLHTMIHCSQTSIIHALPFLLSSSRSSAMISASILAPLDGSLPWNVAGPKGSTLGSTRGLNEPCPCATSMECRCASAILSPISRSPLGRVSSRARCKLRGNGYPQLIDIDVPLVRNMFLGQVVVCLFGRAATTSAAR